VIQNFSANPLADLLKARFMQHFSISPRAMVASLWHHRGLTHALIKRDVIGRYRGSMLGILWSFFNPLFMLAVYTFVFGLIFKSRWPGGSDSKVEFALILFAGLIVFNIFSETVTRAPSLILSNSNYVKKVVFPLEILPIVALGTAFFHAGISLLVWLIFYCLFFGVPSFTVLLLPLILLPLLVFSLGCSWILASLGVYLRDVGQFIGLAVTALMFLTPIFYPVAALPDDLQSLLFLNPLTSVVEQTRDVLIWDKLPDGVLFSIDGAISIAVAWLGFAWFQKTRKGFADVL
jgi:lipopolysaccharide transport system permease protein